MSSTSGIISTAGINARKYDVADVISLLDVARYPLLAILTNVGKDPVTKQGKSIKKKETTDPEFKWFEDTFGARTATVASAQSIPASGGSFAVGTGEGNYFQAGDIIEVLSQKWVFKVTGVSTDTVSVGAEIGGSTATSTSIAGSDVWIIGNSNQEGAGLRNITSTSASEMTGYTQIFRTVFGVSETARNTITFIKENDLDYQRRKKAIEHMVDIERAFIFGKKGKLATGPERFTDGVLNRISTYATADVNSEADFESFLQDGFTHGNTEKYLFAGPAVVSMINGWAKGKLEITQGEKNYGLTIIKYFSPHGTVNIIKHDLLTGSVYGNYGILLDLECLTYRYLTSRDTKLLTNRQNPGEDSVVEEYLTECGLQAEQESRHAVMSISSL